jgi:hypothetical protein
VRDEEVEWVRGKVESGLECPVIEQEREMEKGWRGCEWDECGAQS